MRVLLADHHPQVLWALITHLQEEPGIFVVGEAADALALLELAEEHSPDMILLDWSLPGQPIKELIAGLRAMPPRPTVIVMSSKLESGRTSLSAGADAFISKGEDSTWLIETLQLLIAQSEKNGKEGQRAKVAELLRNPATLRS